MYYNDAYFGQQFDPNPQFIPQQQPQQPQQPAGINPMQALQAYQQFSGGGAAAGQGSAGPAGTAGAGGATGSTAGAAGAGGEGMMGAAASSPIGWIAAAALAQNVAHNKGISSWQAGLKGQGGRNIGEHLINQWGMEDTLGSDVMGLAGWGEGGGYFNPGNIAAKIFGETD